jgi:CheY-like chemotaxis protein
MATRPPLVAVVNNDPDLINMLATWFETHGIRAVCGSLRDFRRGHQDVAAFLTRHNPTIVLYDISMPFGPNWDFLEALRIIPETSGVPILVTTSNKAALEKAVGPTTAFEVTGTAENLTELTAGLVAAYAP